MGTGAYHGAGSERCDVVVEWSEMTGYPTVVRFEAGMECVYVGRV